MKHCDFEDANIAEHRISIKELRDFNLRAKVYFWDIFKKHWQEFYNLRKHVPYTVFLLIWVAAFISKKKVFSGPFIRGRPLFIFYFLSIF